MESDSGRNPSESLCGVGADRTVWEMVATANNLVRISRLIDAREAEVPVLLARIPWSTCACQTLARGVEGGD